MIRHVLLFKFLPDTQAEAAEFLRRLDALKDVIDEIHHQEIYQNINFHRNYDTVCVIDFLNQEDYQKYCDDERHKQVARYSKPYLEDLACVDYEVL